MKRLIVVFLLISSVAFANPFVGRWKADSDHYYVTDTHISAVIDGERYESDYTYNDWVWQWKDRAWIYFFKTPDSIWMVSFWKVSDHWFRMTWNLIRVPQEGT